MHSHMGNILRVARLQNKVGTNYFFEAPIFLTKIAPKYSPKNLSLHFVRQKKIRRIPAKFLCKQIKRNQLRASAGAQGETIRILQLPQFQLSIQLHLLAFLEQEHCYRNSHNSIVVVVTT